MVNISLGVVVAAIVWLFSAIDVEATAEIVTGPLLLIGLGLGGLASQLGSVTVSAVPDSQSPEVGGLQNTASQQAEVDEQTTQAIVDAIEQARVVGLRRHARAARAVRASRIVLHESDPYGAARGTAIGCNGGFSAPEEVPRAVGIRSRSPGGIPP